MQFDQDKYEFYLEGTFFLVEGLLMNDMVHPPTKTVLQDMRRRYSDSEIEKLYNHFHLSAITEDLGMQRKCAARIEESWRRNLRESFPNQNFTVTIDESEYEIEITIHRD